MNPAFQLSRLQKIDTDLDQIASRQNENLTKIQDTSIVDEVKLRISEAEKVRNNFFKQLREIEEKNQQFQIKLQESESALYGGKIRLPRELQDLQNEIASLKKQISVLDENQFDGMITLEELDLNLSNIRSELVNAESQYATKVAAAKGDNSALDRKKENLLSERHAVIQNLDDESINKYENLRKTKRGLAVALVSEQACVGCGSTLTPADWQAARSPQRLVFCSTCGRILYSG